MTQISHPRHSILSQGPDAGLETAPASSEASMEAAVSKMDKGLKSQTHHPAAAALGSAAHLLDSDERLASAAFQLGVAHEQLAETGYTQSQMDAAALDLSNQLGLNVKPAVPAKPAIGTRLKGQSPSR